MMAIIFDKGGVIHCNTVKYNYKQVRNMIADNCYGNETGTSVWTQGTGLSISTSPAGYKSYKAFKFEGTGTTYYNNVLKQWLPKLIANHKYYLSFMYMSTTASPAPANEIIACYVYNDNDGHDMTGSVTNVAILRGVGTNGNWTKCSSIFTSTSNYNDPFLGVGVYGSSVAYTNRFILIDLTDTFGTGNEPTKAWCDNNIREQETYVNFGSTSPPITEQNYNTYFNIINDAWVDNANYLQTDDHASVRDYQLYFQTATSRRACNLNTSATILAVYQQTYYIQIAEHHDFLSTPTENGQALTFIFPAGQIFGTTDNLLVDNTLYNSGGGMQAWKRVSVFMKNPKTNTRAIMGVGFNNLNQYMQFWVTAFCIVAVPDNIDQYNLYNGSSISLDDVNKEWCDRWIDGRGNPIIHIKDPANTAIEFEKPDYDIRCNDIEIRPELNEIQFDKTTGTIRCKKLIKVQTY